MSSLEYHLNEAEIEFDSQILAELISLVDELNISNEDLVNEWEAYQYNNKNKQIDASSINPSSFQTFSKYLRYSKSVKVTKKTRSRSKNNSNPNFIHNANTLKPLMESLSTPNANNLNKTRKRRIVSTTKAHHFQSRINHNNNNTNNDIDNKMDTFLNMTTPSKPSSSSLSSRTSSTVKMTPSSITSSVHKRHRNSTIPTNIMQSPAPINNTYKSRKRKGETVCILNESLSTTQNNKCHQVDINMVVPDSSIDGKYNIVPVGNNNNTQIDPKQYRFMYEDIHSKQDAIKQRIAYIGQQLMQQIKRDLDKELNKEDGTNDMDVDDEKTNSNEQEQTEEQIVYSAVDEPSQRSCYFLGRIMNDGDNAGSDKITAGNIILEGDFDTSYGKRVKLDISGLHSVCLFPGQIVVVKGINSSGKEINVEKIYQNSYAMDRPIVGGNSNDDGLLTMMVGCGPFTPKNSVEFTGSPLHDFGQIVRKNQPNVVVLMGPFTDCDNDCIKNNDLNVTFDELFQHLLDSFIRCVGDCCQRILVIPSTKDVHHFSAFPQEKYMMNAMFSNYPYVSFMNNPSEFSINNVSFGICSADFIFDCCKIGLTKNINDRLLSIMSHCINQQNFYPLQPTMKSLRMDYNKSNYLYIQNKLDIFIMPSTLKQFAKIYKNTNTVCINPSFLTRLNTGGTFAVLTIDKSNDYNINNYSDLIRVDILRI